MDPGNCADPGGGGGGILSNANFRGCVRSVET
jgi:hypothetical protein